MNRKWLTQNCHHRKLLCVWNIVARISRWKKNTKSLSWIFYSPIASKRISLKEFTIAMFNLHFKCVTTMELIAGNFLNRVGFSVFKCVQVFSRKRLEDFFFSSIKLSTRFLGEQSRQTSPRQDSCWLPLPVCRGNNVIVVLSSRFCLCGNIFFISLPTNSSATLLTWAFGINGTKQIHAWLFFVVS